MVGKQGDSVAVREESAQARSEPGGVDEVHEVAFAGMLLDSHVWQSLVPLPVSVGDGVAEDGEHRDVDA